MHNTVKKILLVVDDERSIQRFLRPILEEQNYKVMEASTGSEALALYGSGTPVLVLLDLGLPDMDGLDVLTHIRKAADTPVIVLSARSQQEDIVTALEKGANDYLTKPFGVAELLARIRVALRPITKTEDGAASVIKAGGLRIHPADFRVYLDGKEIHLTPIEFNLLVFLAKNADKVITHQQLLQRVWGGHASGRSNYLRIYIHQLRHKIEAEPAKPRYLKTESGVGYRFVLNN